MTLVNDNPTILEERQLFMHVDHDEKILLSITYSSRGLNKFSRS
jgi:hypothetical protein